MYDAAGKLKKMVKTFFIKSFLLSFKDCVRVDWDLPLQVIKIIILSFVQALISKVKILIIKISFKIIFYL